MSEAPLVLIADDQQTLRLLIRASLRNVRCRVLEAADGQTALRLALNEHPALVMLDVGMPKLDGVAVCRAIRQDHRTRDSRVVILTARAQPGERELGLQAGADAYLTKPFRPAELRAIVQRMLETTP
ncbi:MAG: response regulator [Chloroflexota bacterium]